MFAATCSHCATRSIIPEARITGVDRSDTGFTLRYRCWCGADAEHLMPSRARPRTRRGERPEPLPHATPLVSVC